MSNFYSQSLMDFSIRKERDPIFSQLEEDVFSKLKELTKDDIPIKNSFSPSFVSFEDAIKELVNLKNKNLNQ
jgi:hypothetical protein